MYVAIGYVVTLRMYYCCRQTTSALSWMLYSLARSADVQDAAYRDTVAVLAGTCGHVTPDALQRLHYIRACIKETFRLRHKQTLICHILSFICEVCCLKCNRRVTNEWINK